MTTCKIARQYRAGMQKAHALGWNAEGLWEPADQLIQHCLPPPNAKDFKALCELLIRIGIDADWAITFEIEALLKQACLFDNASAEATRTIGRTHPVFYGILRINDLTWPAEIKGQCIDEFVTLIHKHTAPNTFVVMTEFYMDAYQLRDALILKYASKHNLDTHSTTGKQLSEKRRRLAEVIAHKRFVGSKAARANSTHSFWESPPRLYIHRDSELAPDNEESDPDGDFFLNNDLGLLATEYQKLTSARKKLRWDRENVPSLSDRNHLSHNKIIHYLRYLLNDDEEQLLALAVLCYATALDPRRLFDIRLTADLPSTLAQVCFDTNKGLLRYGIIGGATNFNQDTSKLPLSQIVTLEISAPFDKFIAKHAGSFKELVKKDYPINSYAKKAAGVRPTLSRIAKSSLCNLHFPKLSRSGAYLLSGKIPIQHQNEHAYYSSDNTLLNDHVRRVLESLINELELYRHIKAPKNKSPALIRSKGISDTEYRIGSQLGSAGPFDFHAACTDSISRHLKGTKSDSAIGVEFIRALNDLEVYYYLLLQFANAGRAVGPHTGYDLSEHYSIYGDKNSKHFKEKLFIPTAPIVLDQYIALQNLRETVLNKTALLGVYYQNTGDQNLAYKVTVDEVKCTGEITKLNAITAIKHMKTSWGLRFPFERTNTPRHMTATFARSQSDETIANAWLNHHIDGFAPFSPTSPANSKKVLLELCSIREKWLATHNFKLITPKI